VDPAACAARSVEGASEGTVRRDTEQNHFNIQRKRGSTDMHFSFGSARTYFLKPSSISMTFGLRGKGMSCTSIYEYTYDYHMGHNEYERTCPFFVTASQSSTSRLFNASGTLSLMSGLRVMSSCSQPVSALLSTLQNCTKIATHLFPCSLSTPRTIFPWCAATACSTSRTGL
jgi:hypothetical protein